MTPEQRLDRLERIARLLYEEATRASRASRKQTKKLKSYIDAQREHEAAKIASEERPEDSETKESLLKAILILNRARQELKH
jgi:hypothetical protein